jgi:ABC-type transport system involved in multi-copper enzyme maturation permease subunit
MISLIKLEIIKFKLYRYGINFMIITLVLIGMTALMGAAEPDGEVMFVTSNQILEFGDVMIRIIFTIFSGVLLARLIIGEFKNSTIKIMFTYPISRKKIMGAKIIIIWTFIFIAILLEEILFGIGVKTIDSMISITPDTITFSNLTDRAFLILYNAAATSTFSLISLFFGMRKKSTSTTIIASIIVGFLINSTSGEQGWSIFTSTIIPEILCVLGVVIAFLSYYYINKKDVN